MSQARMRLASRLAGAIAAAAWLGAPLAKAGDWPQILGPHRNGQAVGEQLDAAWPAEGPPRLWTAKLGQGYAGPAIVGERVLVFHRVGASERIEAFDAASGRSLWQRDFAASYRGGIDPDVGPRCTPVVAGERVYAFGAAGDLHCVALADGAEIWSRALYEDLSGDEGFFGAGSTPLVLGDRVLVNVGGDGAGIVALDAASGETLWSKTDEGASYSSPTACTLQGESTAVFVTRLNVVAIDPATGAERFRFPFGARGPTVNAATPLVFDGKLFVSASYGVGAKLVDVSRPTPQAVWANDDVMSSQYTTCVQRGGFLYGSDGREDVGEAALRCVEAATGKAKWSVEGFGVAHLILSEDRLLVQKSNGTLLLAEASPEKWKPLAEFAAFTATVRALPALSQGRYVARSSGGGGGELRCYQVGRGAQP